MASIEDLANEILLEIFQYIDGYLLYKAFWNLNTRIRNLITYSSFPLTIDSSQCNGEDLTDYYREFIVPNKHRIRSLHLEPGFDIKSFFQLITPINLQSVRLFHMNIIELEESIKLLTTSPRLFSLDLSVGTSYFSWDELGRIYQLIFRSPVLKYIRLFSKAFNPIISLEPNPNNQFSTIETMIISHVCYLDQLLTLLSYTPRLITLIYNGSLRLDRNGQTGRPTALFNLRKVSIRKCYLNFDHFEKFIKPICSKLERIHLNTYRDPAYIDAYRWERLISSHMPHLHEFHFVHQESFYPRFILAEYHSLISGFTSLFWTERQWIFQLEISEDMEGDKEITYSICSNKKGRHLLQEIINCSEGHIDKSEILAKPIINCTEFEDRYPIFAAVRITTLYISTSNNICNDTFIDLIKHLSNLNTSSIWSISLHELQSTSMEGTNLCSLTPNNNEITEINFENMDESVQLQFLLDLCSLVKYLEIKHWPNIDLKLLIPFILKQIITDSVHHHTIVLCTRGNMDQAITDLTALLENEILSLPVINQTLIRPKLKINTTNINNSYFIFLKNTM